MTTAIGMKIDRDVIPSPVYIRYPREAARTRTVDVEGSVIIDFDDVGRPVGVELVEVDAYTITLVRSVAEYGLTLPALRDVEASP